MRGTNRIAHLQPDIRRKVVELRRNDMSPMEIWTRLKLEKKSEQNAVSAICNEPGLRVYGKSFEVGGPVKAGRNPAAVIRP